MGDRAVPVKHQRGRRAPDVEPANQVEPGFGVDLHMRDALDRSGDVAEDLPGGAARSAESGGELHQRGPAAEHGSDVSLRQPSHAPGFGRTYTADPALAR